MEKQYKKIWTTVSPLSKKIVLALHHSYTCVIVLIFTCRANLFQEKCLLTGLNLSIECLIFLLWTVMSSGHCSMVVVFFSVVLFYCSISVLLFCQSSPVLWYSTCPTSILLFSQCSTIPPLFPDLTSGSQFYITMFNKAYFI